MAIWYFWIAFSTLPFVLFPVGVHCVFGEFSVSHLSIPHGGVREGEEGERGRRRRRRGRI